MTFARRSFVKQAVQKWFDERVFFGFDEIPDLKQHIASKTPFVFVDHAYMDRGYERNNFRIIRDGIHRRTIKAGPPRKHPTPKDWKRGSKILIFPASQTIRQTFDANGWLPWAIETLKKHTDRPIILKHKSEPMVFDDVHAVIGFGSVASVESVIAGIPAFCGPWCPATPVGLQDLSQIESPIYPDREAWLNSLAWSQFHISEINSGFCKEFLDGEHLPDADRSASGHAR